MRRVLLASAATLALAACGAQEATGSLHITKQLFEQLRRPDSVCLTAIVHGQKRLKPKIKPKAINPARQS